MKKYDFIIVGCGISCLYFLKKLKGLNIQYKTAILEKKPFPGGRIQSLTIGNEVIDSGAFRFTDKHYLVKSLLNNYEIKDIEELDSKISTKVTPNLFRKFSEFLDECKNSKYDNYSFGEVAKSKFTMAEYETLKLWFGYDQKWEESNCRNLATHLLPNYDSKKYFHVKNGLSQLVNLMYEELKENYDFFFGEKVMKLADGNNIYTMSGKHFTAENIIFACPPHFIKNIEGTEQMTPLLVGVGEQVLNRIYAKFNNNSWFPKEVVHCFEPISQIVPVNEEIIMVSYSTNRSAQYWMQQEMNGTLWKTLRDDLIANGIKIGNEKPVWIKQNYWNPGTHYYKPGFNAKKTQNLSFKPIHNKKWHIIGESFSENQGWMEGALENTELFFKKFFSGKLQMPDKKYSLKEVEKHNKDNDAWLAIHGNVYNITNWIDQHPGGSVIKYGIGKDATNMFISAGHHEDALEFMNHYKIGILE